MATEQVRLLFTGDASSAQRAARNVAGSLGGLIRNLVPWIAHQPAVEGKAIAYLCRDGACQLPTSDLNVYRRQLDEWV